jgi:chemotaxis protein methyltransferase CheR
VAKRVEIPAEFQQSSIDLGRREARGWFRIKPEVKERVNFKQHNLIEHTVPGERIFDLVLCRNVLIYFAPENVDFVQSKLYTTVREGGHLLIGHSESFQGLKHQWTMIGPSVFKKGL